MSVSAWRANTGSMSKGKKPIHRVMVNKETKNFFLTVGPHNVSLNGQGELWQIAQRRLQCEIGCGLYLFGLPHKCEGQKHPMELSQFYYLWGLTSGIWVMKVSIQYSTSVLSWGSFKVQQKKKMMWGWQTLATICQIQRISKHNSLFPLRKCAVIIKQIPLLLHTFSRGI